MCKILPVQYIGNPPNRLQFGAPARFRLSSLKKHVNVISRDTPFKARAAVFAVEYIQIYEPGQPFRFQFVLYRLDFVLIKQTLNRTSRCNKVEAVRLYA